jgi:6,7-dimethyl-8-ribityllumazine synthase
MPAHREQRVVVVVSRFNEAVTRRLLDGALEALQEHEYPRDRVDVFWVPGAFELPVVVDRAVRSGRYEFAVALGAVIRGETTHFDFIATEITRGLGDVALHSGKAVGFGLLTCETMEQAVARAGGEAGNKGAEAALAALEASQTLSRIDDDQK